MSSNRSQCHRFDLSAVVSGHGEATHGPPGAIGTIPGTKNGQTKVLPPSLGPLGLLLGAALKGMLHWSYYAYKIERTIFPPSRGIAILGGWVDTSGV